MPRVYTSTIRYNGAGKLDISVKSSHGIGKLFAPTWDMVMGYKQGLITKEEYTEQYHQLMLKSFEEHKSVWLELLEQPVLVLCCYCRRGDFCHRQLLYYYLTELGMIGEGEI